MEPYVRQCKIGRLFLLGKEKFGKCSKYSVEETEEDLANGYGRQCRVIDSFILNTTNRHTANYCKTWKCPTVTCEKSFKGDDGCIACPGK